MGDNKHNKHNKYSGSSGHGSDVEYNKKYIEIVKRLLRIIILIIL